MARRSWIVGLTGGIGTGKSRVAELLRSWGAAVECADQVVRQLQSPGSPVLAAIAAEFGPTILRPSGELDREALGAIVFRDPDARQRLERLVHPEVLPELTRRMAAHQAAGTPVIALDIPLLLEGKKAGRGAASALPFDAIALVYASPATQIERVMARDGLSRDAAQRRVLAQMPIDEKRGLADVVIENDGDWSKTEDQVRAVVRGARR
jgi:dephospho-CoA kinase